MSKTFILLLILLVPNSVLAAEFDIWKTGMTLSQVVETARQNNIPIRQSGIISINKGFNQKLINERFWKAESVEYFTILLGYGAKVVLKIHPDWPRRVYEIEVRFAGKSSNQEFKAELVKMLTGKYGQPDRAFLNLHKTYRWRPAEGDEILLTMYSFPLLSYADVGLKEHALKQLGYKAKNKKHGYTKQESGKF